MRLDTFSCRLAALCSASLVLAESIQTPATSQASTNILVAEPTATVGPHLDVRQNLGVVPDAGTVAGGQAPAITIYTDYIPKPGGAVPSVMTYEQTFVSVPDQWPTAIPGTIGLGTLQNRKRDAVNTEYVAQTVVMQIETVFVTQNLRRVTEVLVVETVVVDQYTAANAKAFGRNITLPASLDPGSHRILPTAPS